MAETIQVDHIGTIEVKWVDEAGNPAKVDGPTTWVSTDPTVVEVVVQPGGSPGQPTPGNPLIANWHTVAVGMAQIQASADADMGDGVKLVTYTNDFTVIQGEAVAGVGTVTDLGPGTPSGGGPGEGTSRPVPKSR